MTQFNTAKHPRSRCRSCGKDIVVMSTRGRGSVGYCSRICASKAKFEKRYTGMRSGKYDLPKDLDAKFKM